ncbi:hypothetical protein C0J52_23708 [Blattella germanica]|nr:hypothetical protein C0J52_23708 [Blattella germanica]
MWLCMVFSFMGVTLVPHTKSVQMLTPTSVLDDKCSYDQECKHDFSFCYEHVNCACKINYTFYEEIKNCVLECSSDRGCFNGNFTCPQSYCKCDKHYISKGQNCTVYKRVHLGENCKDVDECIESKTTKIQCLHNICSCDNGFRHIGNDTCQSGGMLW